MASAVIRFDSGEAEKWAVILDHPRCRRWPVLAIILSTKRCSDLPFLSVLGSDELKRISYSPAAGRAPPCRRNSAVAPRWKLLTKVVNSPQV